MPELKCGADRSQRQPYRLAKVLLAALRPAHCSDIEASSKDQAWTAPNKKAGDAQSYGEP